MYEFFVNLCYVLNRYFHIVFAMLLVGGTLFFEMVVPVAIGELKHEQQLLVLARARWMFRSIVMISSILLLLSGVFSSRRNWSSYQAEEQLAARELTRSNAALQELPFYARPKFWWMLHAVLGSGAIIVAVLLVSGKTPPDRPMLWMRVNLIVLMLAILMASVTRHHRLTIVEHLRAPSTPHVRE
jgi:peptidoglycan/LPS O-acetylase OafA/YrhL